MKIVVHSFQRSKVDNTITVWEKTISVRLIQLQQAKSCAYELQIQSVRK